MFDDFDPKLLDDPEFKEDSVREEIIVPILKRLGYSASGANRIVRSKTLLHPFVMIGSKKYPIHIVPDYLLYSDDHPGWILDAKRPDAALIQSTHAEQAYSYAIHPEVRVRFYALCNGRQLVAYDIHGIAPIFAIDFPDIERDWGIIESVLSPKNVARVPEHHLAPDFGIAVIKMGSKPGSEWIFPFAKFSQFGCVETELFTMTAGVAIEGVDHLASFDTTKALFDQFLSFTDEDNRNHLLQQLKPGRFVYSKRPLYGSLKTVVGNPARGQHDVFVPFVVSDVKPLDERRFKEAEALFSGSENATANE